MTGNYLKLRPDKVFSLAENIYSTTIYFGSWSEGDAQPLCIGRQNIVATINIIVFLIFLTLHRTFPFKN
jgi:hypothetical protein